MLLRKEAFRYFSSFEKFQSLKLTLTSFTDFLNLLGLVDGKTLRVADIDTDLKASTDCGSQSIAALSRCEFLETIVRIAIDKFYRSQLVRTEEEAVEKLVFDHLLPAVGALESDKWRYARYFNEDCASLLAVFEPELSRIFTRFSGKYAVAGERGMSLEEFQLCCAELLSKGISQRLCGLCFQLALSTQTDCFKRQSQLSFVEFLEALARAVDFGESQEPEKAILTSRWDSEPLDTKLDAVLRGLNLRASQRKPTTGSRAALHNK